MLTNERKEKKSSARELLVTGATGFLGRHLVGEMLACGEAVRALGRNLDIGMQLAKEGADFRPVDLRDRPAMITACRGVQGVVHAGALSSAWGKYKDFYDINVEGTKNVIDACLANDVERLVYISSPSVMSRHEEQLNLDESHPLPEKHVSMYSETKALAEREVQKANQQGLKTVILRPKAIYGPGDQSTFPRIIDVLSKGRLPVFGNGETFTNITHVSDVVQSILLALESDKAVGNTYLITGGESVNLWDIIGRIAREMGYPPPSKQMSEKKAMIIGGLLEDTWRLLHLNGEPPLNRYKVSIMTYSQTYDIAAAERDLGYTPKVSWQAGVDDFLSRIKTGGEKSPSQTIPNASEKQVAEPLPVKLTIMEAGATAAPARVFGLGKGWKKMRIPALFALIEHPVQGSVLFDTGYSTHFYDATRKFPEKLYGLITEVDIGPEENASARVAEHGHAPESIKWIIVSHFDPDHIGGLKDFPHARIVCSRRAYEGIVGKTGVKALRERLLTGLLPADLTGRLLLLPDFDGPSIGPFAASADMFGDGSIRMVSLPGHAVGQLGAFVRTEDGKDLFLCADACWTRVAITERDPMRGLHYRIAKDKPAQKETYEKLMQLQQQMPGVYLFPAHCPQAARDWMK